MGCELLAVVADQFEGRVRDLLVVEPPLLQLAFGIVVELCGVGDVVALPRVGMELVDLLLHEAQVLPAREDLPVREKPRRAGDAVDPVPHGGGLVAGEVHRGERLIDAARDARLGAARRLEQAKRRIAQDRDRHLAVEIDVLDELHEMEVRAGDRRLAERRVPRAPGTPQLIGQALGVERILVEAGGRSRRTGALRHRAQRQRAVEGLADHVQLVVEHEEIARHAVCRVRRPEQLERIHVEEAAEHFVHGDESRRHAPRRSEEAPAAHAEPAARLARELGDAYLELALLQGLSERKVFAVRHHLRRDRRAQLVGLVGARQSGKLALGQPGVFFA